MWNWTSGLSDIPEPQFINTMDARQRGQYLDLDRIFTAMEDVSVSSYGSLEVGFVAARQFGL